jgi:cytochrome c oxidase subunit IV
MADTATHNEPNATSAHDEHDDHHPTEAQYWIIFVILAVLTAVEVAWSYLGLSGPALVLPLLAMMVVKFFLVAGAFMHLYFDLKILNGRLFTWAFGGATVLALSVYFIVFASFRFTV